VQREAVTSVEAAAGLVRRASAARAVEATQMNAVSSRSHTIFMLYITGHHEASGSKLTGRGLHSSTLPAQREHCLWDTWSSVTVCQ